MRHTIKDVAKRAGVSVATVSLALNNPDSAVSDKTRETVNQAAQELNYRPNRLAVSLVTKKSQTIGLIIPDNENSFQAAFSGQIEKAASEHGYTLIFGIANSNAERTVNQLHDFSDRGVDGIILDQSIFQNPDDTQLCLEAISGLHLPIVLINRVPKTYFGDMVRINGFQGGYDAISHLIGLGHRRIGIITGPLYSCAGRLEGCKAALEEAGIPFDESFLYEGDWHLGSGISGLPYLLGKGVTAVFAFNDMMAYGIYKEMRNFNLRIPGDLSVIGFDDIFFSDIIQPPLTTMEYPMREMANAAVDCLINRINGDDSSSAFDQAFSPILKVRGSTMRISEQQQKT